MENSGNLTVLTERNRVTRQRQLADSRVALCGLIGQCLHEARDAICSDLENLASGTVERTLQIRYLRLKQDVDEHWPDFVAAALHFLNNPDSDGKAGACDRPLQLLDEDELAEQIVLREFSARLCESCHQELFGLEQRVAHLLERDTPPSPEENPLGPYQICSALKNAAASLPSTGEERESRPLLLRRLETPLHQKLPEIYHRINGQLIERGILTEIKSTFRRSPLNPLSARIHQPSTQEQAKSAAISEEILTAIQNLAAQESPANSTSDSPRTQESVGVPQPALRNPAFVSKLDEFQKMDWKAITENEPTKANLIWRVRNSEASSHVGHIEAATIDIVGMLFDFIFEDTALSSGVKALVGRLQIPVLKIALQDQRFFSNRDHPARYFLDDIAGISLRWGGEIRDDDPFYQKLESLVTRIQQEFTEDVEIFSQAIESLAAFVDERDAEAKPAVDAVVETASHREIELNNTRSARKAARNKARETVQTWVDKPIYPPIRDFFDQHWVRVLEEIALDSASTEEDWNNAVQFMADLAWSISLPSRQQRTRLIALVPRVLADLQSGLDRIQIPESARQPFLDMLYELHSANIKAALSGPLPEPEARYLPASTNDADSHGELVFTRYLSRGIEVEEITLVGKLPQGRMEDVAAQAAVRALQRGDWIEFHTKSESPIRAVLKWISPKKGLLVFMHHNGKGAFSISPEALTVQLREGMARAIEVESIIERALSNVLITLKGSPEGVRKYTPSLTATPTS